MAADDAETPVRSPAEDPGSGKPDTLASPGDPGGDTKATKPMKAAKAPKSAKKGKGGAGASGRAAGGHGAGGGGSNLILAEHPRAVRGVARAKAWGGLGGFLLGGYLSLPTHTLPDAGIRALAAGAACYVAAWGAAVFLWRRLLVAELHQAQHELLAAELAKLRGAGGLGSTAPNPHNPSPRTRPRAGV